jgi:hypothetical protein
MRMQVERWWLRLTKVRDQRQPCSARSAWLHIACKIAILRRWCGRKPHKLTPAVRRIADRTGWLWA